MRPISNSYRPPSLRALTRSKRPRLQLKFGGDLVTTGVLHASVAAVNPDEVTKASLLTRMIINSNKDDDPTYARVFTVVHSNPYDVCVSALYRHIQDAAPPTAAKLNAWVQDQIIKRHRAKRSATDALDRDHTH